METKGELLVPTWYVDKTGSEFLARLYWTKEEVLEETQTAKESLEDGIIVKLPTV